MKLFTALSLIAIPATARILQAETATTSTTPSVAPAQWDGQCFYPVADAHFKLDTYYGKWYQVAGTLAPFTAGCKCISAQYAPNKDGSVLVNNTCERGGTQSNIIGSAVAADTQYGKTGVFRVQFPRQPAPECPGPNYIVQAYDGEFAIVQTSNFSTLFILSRKQQLSDATLDKLIKKAAKLGTKIEKIVKTDQSNCKCN